MTKQCDTKGCKKQATKELQAPSVYVGKTETVYLCTEHYRIITYVGD